MKIRDVFHVIIFFMVEAYIPVAFTKTFRAIIPDLLSLSISKFTFSLSDISQLEIFPYLQFFT